MINENSSFVSNNSFCKALKDLCLGRYLTACGFNKRRGVPILFVIYGLLTTVFNYSNLYQKTQSKKGFAQCNCTDQVFYDVAIMQNNSATIVMYPAPAGMNRLADFKLL